MTGSPKFGPRSYRALFICLLLAPLLIGAVIRFPQAGAQSLPPILISEETSTRALVFDSTTREREPFTANAQVAFGVGSRRLMIFAMNLQLQPGDQPSAVVARAEDAAHQIYFLPVEYVGATPGQPWATSIIVALDPAMADLGDVLVGLTYRGISTNRVRIGIGHIGGGPPDDPGAVPTPGGIAAPPAATAGNLTTSDVETIISQAVSAAVSLNRTVTVAVTDREGHVLGVFSMTGASATTTIRSVGSAGMGLEGSVVPASLAAISKAGTGAFFSTGGNAFTTRTAGFIIQEHFPPGIDFRPGGPLYGVQFSSLPCSDIKIPGLPLGLSGDPGGLPVYKGGLAVGGVGIEGDGLYTVDRNPADLDQPPEELIAAAAVRGFEAPTLIRGDNILVDGIRLPYSNVATPPAPPTIAFGSLPGAIVAGFPIRPAQTSAFVPAQVGGVAGEVDTRFFPFVAGSSPAGPNALTAANVQTIMIHAIQQANITRAAIRQPLGSNGRVTITVVDAAGNVLGLFRQLDAPVFGVDVSVQKARTATFFSRSDTATLLSGAGLDSYVSRAAGDGMQLNGTVAFTARAIGFLHRPFFPDGINNTAAGPLSTSLTDWSPFNVGFQLDLVQTNLLATLGGAAIPCSAIPFLPNGVQIFAGSTPLYKNGILVGAVGVSGDGIDQDDLVSAAGANGYSPAPAIRSDQIFVRSVRLPFLKFPRSPNL